MNQKDSDRSSGRKDKNNKRKTGTLKERLRYHFDNIMSRGTFAKVLLLLIFSCIVVILLAFIDYRIEMETISQTMWDTMNHTFDPGNLYGDERSRGSLIVMLIATLFGMFFTATLIGIINTGLEEHMDRLSKGKSKVLENNHTILLGFTETTFIILEELMRANENQSGRNTVVIMDHGHEASEMESTVQIHLSRFLASLPEKERKAARRHTRIIFRSGRIYDAADLQMCSIETCRSIIINSTDDIHTLKSIMACAVVIDNMRKKQGPDAPYPRITAMIMKKSNIDTACAAGKGYLKLICYEELMSRIITCNSRCPGLSFVYMELFNFRGNEFYCVPKSDIPLNPALMDQLTLYDINQYLKSSIAVGGFRRSESRPLTLKERLRNPWGNIRSRLTPTMPDKKLKDLDYLYLLEQDDDTVEICPSRPAIHHMAKPARCTRRTDEHYVIVGNGALVLTVMHSLDSFLLPGTRLTVIRYAGRHTHKTEDYIRAGEHLDVHCAEADLENYISIADAVPPDTTSVIILADEPSEADENIAEKEDRPVEDVIDEKTLSRLIFLRQIREDQHMHYNITCEMNLDRNRRLAAYMDAEDFIVGSKITALIMTQISQTPSLLRLFMEILDPIGTEIYFRRAGDYLDTDAPEGFTLYEAADVMAKQGEVLIGLRRQLKGKPGCYDTARLNPPRWENRDGFEAVKTYHLHPDDELVVLACQL